MARWLAMPIGAARSPAIAALSPHARLAWHAMRVSHSEHGAGGVVPALYSTPVALQLVAPALVLGVDVVAAVAELAKAGLIEEVADGTRLCDFDADCELPLCSRCRCRNPVPRQSRCPNCEQSGSRPRADAKQTPRRDAADAAPATDSTRHDRHDTTEKSTRAARSSIDLEGFDAFWTAFDHKVALPAAQKVWKRIRPSAELAATIAARATAYAAATPDKAFRKHPATWLNNACWNDELPAAPSNRRNGVAALRNLPPVGVGAYGESGPL